MKMQDVSRRGFLKSAAALGLAVQAVPLINTQAQQSQKKFKVGLIGCGFRGTIDLGNFIEAAKLLGVEIEVLATADVFKEEAVDCGKECSVPAAHCCDGFSGYRRMLELPVDIVLLATPPSFRPLHFEAAVAAGKHVFMEKPCAVDPPGIRRVIAVGEIAKQKGLTVVAGTQRRHMADYQQIVKAVQAGLIGKIVGGRVSYCTNALWFKTREPGEDDAHYMARNWSSFVEMSGDHIVEQHVHNLDVANWLTGRPPKQAAGVGGRARRQTGDQYDFFSVDYDYGDELHIHSMSRQIDGCYDTVLEQFIGTQGTTMGSSNLRSLDGKKLELPEIKLLSDNGHVQEHVDLLQSVLSNAALNTAQTVAHSTLTAIMGRMAAYTGQLVRWSDLMEHQDSPFYNLKLSPCAEDFEQGPVTAPPENVAAVPGRAGKMKSHK